MKKHIQDSLLIALMSAIMAFSSICMIHYAAHLDLYGTAFMELIGPILGYFYLRVQIKEEKDINAFINAVTAGVGFMTGSIFAIKFLEWST